MDLEHLVYDKLKRTPEQVGEPKFLPAYRWLEREVGFFPFFLSFGLGLEDINMTGYYKNWLKEFRGENSVLLSFRNVEGVFMDIDKWARYVLNNEEMSDYERREIFKYSLCKSDWLKKVRKKPGTVQLVTSTLDCREAGRVLVRNISTRKIVEEMGFKNVRIKIIK